MLVTTPYLSKDEKDYFINYSRALGDLQETSDIAKDIGNILPHCCPGKTV
jgi:hypothetical protein